MTTLMRWSPHFTNRRDLNGLRNEFDQLFDTLITTPATQGAAPVFAPAADIHENAEGFEIRLDLPGVAQKDVKVSIMGDTLTIRGERKFEEQRDPSNVRYRERRFGAFERVFTLTAPVRADQVKASYLDGVLEVRIPKAEEARTREIEVQIG
ncbi:MAG: Hsp20/alpha crystallin family protein [Candidatus Eisenbacteria bacterium]